MRFMAELRHSTAAGLLALSTAAGGCGHALHSHRVPGPLPPPPTPLGTLSVPIWQTHERNAEASDFVIYEHEFQVDGIRLNYAGEDHVKQIAARLNGGIEFPVLVERSRHSVDPYSEFKYPVHLNPALDLRRREVVVQALLAMGVEDAEHRVVISPALTDGYESFEAQRAYMRGVSGSGFGGFGGSGGGGRFGGFGF
jgi:hypothetical protein